MLRGCPEALCQSTRGLHEHAKWEPSVSTLHVAVEVMASSGVKHLPGQKGHASLPLSYTCPVSSPTASSLIHLPWATSWPHKSQHTSAPCCPSQGPTGLPWPQDPRSPLEQGTSPVLISASWFIRFGSKTRRTHQIIDVNDF